MKRKVEQVLLAWKNKGKNRMPLILNGARQVGKTYILLSFGERYYKNTVYINMETNTSVAAYFNENIAPERLIQYLESFSGEAIIPGETLLIFDEIQTCERALTSLKYFCEETPEYHIACAGSLLGVAINRQQYSYPVGKVDTITLYPFDFEEYLWALGEEKLSEEIRRSYQNMDPMPELLHNKAMDLYRQYLIIGGMPAAIKAYLETKRLITIPDVQNKIMNDYVADMSKYASESESVKIRACYNSIPAQLAKENKKFQYKVIQKGGSSAAFGVSIEWLNFAGIVLKCQRIEQGTLPIAVYADLSSFKLYMGDVGLLTMKAGLPQITILNLEENRFMGAVAENYIAQTLAANGYLLNYWTGKQSEVDFVIQIGEDVVPIEVKSGGHTQSKSLNHFMQQYKSKYGIRISAKNFGISDKIKSIPLYAAFCI